MIIFIVLWFIKVPYWGFIKNQSFVCFDYFAGLTFYVKVYTNMQIFMLIENHLKSIQYWIFSYNYI